MPSLIVACGVAAYASSFQGVFLFDDVPHIALNQDIRSLWPIGPVVGQSLRPLLFYSLAVNYAISGPEVWSYHLVNLLIHLLAALALFGVVRRSFAFEPLRRWAHLGDGIALVSALLWVTHPLTTQAVTYIIQRSEAMASMFYLAALYAFIRAVQGERSLPWFAASVFALGLGLGSKEIAVTAPAVLLLYDRCLVAGTFSGALRARWGYYGVFAAAPLALFAGRWAVGLPNKFVFVQIWAGLSGQRYVPVRDGFVFAPLEAGQVGGLQYLATQPEILLHYLRLTVWPSPLVLDYGWEAADGSVASVTAALVVAAALVSVGWLLVRQPPAGFVAAAVFIVLLPSSSFIPIKDLAAEHRFYLALAGVITLGVATVAVLMDRPATPGSRRRPPIALAGVVALVVVFGLLTFARNFDYHAELAMWRDVAANRPNNTRAHFNVGTLLLDGGDTEGAIESLERAVAVSPTYARAIASLGVALAHGNDPSVGEPYYRRALAIDPATASAHVNLGVALLHRGEAEAAIYHFDEAINHASKFSEPLYGRYGLLANTYTNRGMAFLRAGDSIKARESLLRALEYDPGFVPAYNNLALVSYQEGALDDALEMYARALEIDAEHAQTHDDRGRVLAASGDYREAIAAYRTAIRLAPSRADYHLDLAVALAALGDHPSARVSYQNALRLDPANGMAHNNFGLLLAAMGDADAALRAFDEASRVNPGLAAAHDNRGTVLVAVGRHDEAVEAHLQALFVDPEFARAHRNVARLFAAQGRRQDAINHFRESLRLDPAQPSVRTQLDRLVANGDGR